MALPKNLSFVGASNVPAMFSCNLCQGLLIQPVLTGCCGISYCKECIEGSADNVCPHCKSTRLSFVTDHRLERQMNSQPISCRYHLEGCLWSGNVHDLLRHLDREDGCLFVDVTCPKNCGKTIQRKNIQEHLEANCYISWSQCEHCDGTIPTDNMDRHLNNDCPQYELSCPNDCGDTIKRADLQDHRDTVCPKELIPCSFKDGGCKVMVERELLDVHLKENQLEHSLIVFETSSKQMSKITDKLDKTKLLAKQQAKSIDLLTNELKETKQKMASMQENTTMLASTLMQELYYISDQPHTSPIKTLAISSMRDQVSLLVNPLLMQLTPGGPSITIRVPMFSQLKAADKPWCSSPFTVQNGYQMAIVFYPNGHGEGRHTHISIHIHLVSGLYDDELNWPLKFNNEIIVSIMKQVTSLTPSAKSRVKTVQPFTQQQRIRTLVHILHRVNKPPGELGLSFGYIALFCAQNNLDSTVLYNDSLVFQLYMQV